MALDSIDLYISPFYYQAAPFPEMDLNSDGMFDFTDLNTANSKYPIVQDYYYSPFGELWQGERATDTNPFRYCGEYHDKETGNIYLRARYYNPSIGRFISVDPIKDGTNWYVYCSNNPIAFVDPSGLRYENVEVLAEALGGTYEYSDDGTRVTITIDDKTTIYVSGFNGAYVNSDGKMYIKGETFGDDFGAEYTEFETDAYIGFEIKYFNGNDYYAKGTSFEIKHTIEGEAFVNASNSSQNAQFSHEVNAQNLAWGIIAIVACSTPLNVAILVGGCGMSYAATNSDISYKLKIDERITLVEIAGISDPTSRSTLQRKAIVYNSDETTRLIASKRY